MAKKKDSEWVVKEKPTGLIVEKSSELSPLPTDRELTPEEKLESVRRQLMVGIIEARLVYQPSAQLETLEAKLNELIVKFNTVVNMLTQKAVEVK